MPAKFNICGLRLDGGRGVVLDRVQFDAQGTEAAFSTRPISEERIKRIHAVLTGALNYAVKVRKILDSSPAVGLFARERSSYKARDNPLLWTGYCSRRGRCQARSCMVWAPKHGGAFLDFIAEERFYPLYHLAMYWGPRRGEVVGLEKPDFSIASRRFHIRRAQPDDELDEVKSGDSNRYVILDDLTAEVMTEWFERQDAESEAWGEAYTDSGHVFTYEDGRPLRPELLTDWFNLQRHASPPLRGGWDVNRSVRKHRTSTERVKAALAGRRCRPCGSTTSGRGGDDGGCGRCGNEGHQRDDLGHASESFTADVYAVVAEELAVDAARKIGGFVPRRAARGRSASARRSERCGPGIEDGAGAA
ncbi:hypothetical protein [Actinomadura rubrisoli]|uniref:Site-specific integrase n=1 Tax=Actinomadura rubrisoli TaxID=2530368 RepID=A0A4V2YYR2_9ACTN|nr:hypothetical protein [Actinomadura rubrisoli]TDD94147.1 hypothetical protein E1298_07490 [Actinomadura rubrisoli]